MNNKLIFFLMNVILLINRNNFSGGEVSIAAKNYNEDHTSYRKASEAFSNNSEKYANAAEKFSKIDDNAINFALFGIGFAGVGIGCWKFKKTFYFKQYCMNCVNKNLNNITKNKQGRNIFRKK